MPRKQSPKPITHVISSPIIEVIPVIGASKLETFGPEWEGWGWDEKTSLGVSAIHKVSAFYRLRPPASATPFQVERIKKWLEANGASVKVERAVRADIVSRDEKVLLEKPHLKAREAVEELLLASISIEKEALVEFVRNVMDQAKL